MELPDDLLAVMDEHNVMAADMGDGAWWAMLEDAVKIYNAEMSTHYDPFDAVHAWVEVRGE